MFAVAPFDVDAKQLACRADNVESVGFERRAHLDGVATRLAVDSSAGFVAAINAFPHESECSSAERLLHFEQFGVHRGDDGEHEVVDGGEGEAFVGGDYFRAENPHSGVAGDVGESVVVERRAAVSAAKVAALPAEADEAVGITESRDVAFRFDVGGKPLGCDGQVGIHLGVCSNTRASRFRGCRA